MDGYVIPTFCSENGVENEKFWVLHPFWATLGVFWDLFCISPGPFGVYFGVGILISFDRRKIEISKNVSYDYICISGIGFMGLFEKLKNRKICKNEGGILCVLSGYFSVIERVCVLEAQNGRKMGVYFSL